MSTTAKRTTDLELEMYREMWELLGEGYVRDYYEQMAQPFVAIAQRFIDEAVKKAPTKFYEKST